VGKLRKEVKREAKMGKSGLTIPTGLLGRSPTPRKKYDALKKCWLSGAIAPKCVKTSRRLMSIIRAKWRFFIILGKMKNQAHKKFSKKLEAFGVR